MVQAISDVLSLKNPIETDLLIVVFDLTNFTKFSKSHESSEVFRQMKVFNSKSAEFAKENGGLILKFLGDACLCIFPVGHSSAVITGMVDFTSEVEKWLKEKMPGSRLAVNCHVGSVTVGPTPGYNGQAQIDVIGEAVNICFTMSNRGFVISPQTFRSLTPDARKRFRKFTPPIVYHLSEQEAQA
jgi:class 3 adenylate cyclase